MPPPAERAPVDGAPIRLSAIAAGAGGAALRHADGRLERLSRPEAAEAFKAGPLIVCHAGFTARRLGLSQPGRRAGGLPPHADVAELFAFVHPARPVIPSPAGLARALGLAPPATLEDAAACVAEAARILLETLSLLGEKDRDECRALAAMAGRSGWATCPAAPPAKAP